MIAFWQCANNLMPIGRPLIRSNDYDAGFAVVVALTRRDARWQPPLGPLAQLQLGFLLRRCLIRLGVGSGLEVTFGKSGREL